MANLKVTLGDAGTGLCLAADAGQAVNGSAIRQYQCSHPGVWGSGMCSSYRTNRYLDWN